MDNDKSMDGQEENPILSLIQQIKVGTLNPKTLSEDLRQRCVEFLDSEGYTAEQIGQILMRNERTIRRDLKKILDRNSLNPNVSLAKQIIGDIFRKTMVHHRYLMRLARSPEATTAEKAQSEFLAWRVLKEMAEKMQTLGYLPLKPQEIVGDFFHHMADLDGEKNIIEVKNMLTEIEQTSKEAGTFDSKTEEQLKALRARVENAEITLDVNKLKQKQEE